MNKNSDAKTKRIVLSSLFAAMVCVATMVIKIPTPLKGYLNLGDCFVLLAGWVLSPLYGFLSAAVGSALADIISGYVIYAPTTFIIKGAMALVAFYGYKLLTKHCSEYLSLLISGLIAELTMIMGYFIYEGFLYGFGVSATNIPANAIQGAAGLILGFILYKVAGASIKKL